jgi:hypothetical protein
MLHLTHDFLSSGSILLAFLHTSCAYMHIYREREREFIILELLQEPMTMSSQTYWETRESESEVVYPNTM